MTAGDTPGTPSQPSDDVVVKQFEWTETPPSIAVVRVLSAVLNEQPTGLDPLYDSVDAEALDTLAQSSTSDFSISFTHQGLAIVVRDDGTVIARPA